MAINQAKMVVIFRLTSDFMIFLLLVKTINGTKAKAMPNDKTTWLITNAFVGLIPNKMMVNGGIIVMHRRR